MSITKAEAIILKCDNYKETSKIVTFYSKSHGKMKGIAKGVRSTNTKWGGSLQPMAHLNLMFYLNENRSLHLISQAEYAAGYTGTYKSIYDDFEKLQTGFRIVELLNKTTQENHENMAMFDLTLKSLENLNNATKNYVNVLFYYEFQLAKLLGFEIDLHNFTKKNIDKKKENGYFYTQRFSLGEIKVLNMLSEGNFNRLMNLNISKTSERAIDRFFENYFSNHLDSILFLNTKKVFN
ncbi:MAG: DNA repair protein RecO [Chlorobi bacterium]|nr:DNA repair protein RecO [Chlorobiota bacterium]MCI0715744.1 DNA repair protein RecO [Chlorobiota bacterium]